MKVFIAGGTGAIGRHATRAVVEAGHEVTAIARTPEKAAMLERQGAKAVHVSVFERSALEVALEGQDAVINLTSAIPPTAQFMNPKAWVANDQVRIEGSAAIVDAALAAGVARVVQESVSMLYPENGSTWIDEDMPTDLYPMARANLAAEANTNRFSNNGRIGVILRFGWFYGPGAKHSEEFLALARCHVCVQMGSPGGYVSSIHMADAGAAVVKALNVSAGTFNIVDDEPLTKREYANALEFAAGKKAWLRLPGQAALLLGDRSTSLTRSLRVSNNRFRLATGWFPKYPSAREGWIATAKLLYPNDVDTNSQDQS
jgi:nucleoside-diphosphate-sugar epimerase